MGEINAGRRHAGRGRPQPPPEQRSMPACSVRCRSGSDSRPHQHGRWNQQKRRFEALFFRTSSELFLRAYPASVARHVCWWRIGAIDRPPADNSSARRLIPSTTLAHRLRRRTNGHRSQTKLASVVDSTYLIHRGPKPYHEPSAFRGITETLRRTISDQGFFAGHPIITWNPACLSHV